MGKKDQEIKDVATRNFNDALVTIEKHPMFAPLFKYCRIIRKLGNLCPENGWVVVTSNGYLHTHPTRRAKSEEWVFVLTHALLHLGLGHFTNRNHFQDSKPEWVSACDCFILKFLADLKLGTAPMELQQRIEINPISEERLFEEFMINGVPLSLQNLGTAGPYRSDMILGPVPSERDKIDWQKLLGLGLSNAVTKAVDVAAGYATTIVSVGLATTEANKARNWFISNYPLLGALAAGFQLIEDQNLCIRMKISVAAVSAELREIYINPGAGLTAAEYRFVIAHELLHVGLRHDTRCQGRDPYLWNVACDYVINGWLMEMNVGDFPLIGGLLDHELKGLSAEAIYDRIVTDIRRFRKLATLRGNGLGDILVQESDWWDKGSGVDLDEFYRRSLMQGLEYHEQQERGLLPAGLVEEIRALSQPPIGWDVELAEWFDNYFRPLEKRRSYARISRRQSATPDIPRPLWLPLNGSLKGRTFGVILDTSGSMDRLLLAKALGAIASYCISRDVPAVRVVFCDAVTYDQGYLLPEIIADRVKVKGRGGTVLQPGINLLENTEDFPKSGPLLIITDGYCDRLKTSREHAFLIPKGRHLPFEPKGKVFRIS